MTIRLADLNPAWTKVGLSALHARQGIGFDCPTHRNHRLWIQFGIHWRPHGNRFDTLTVTPSIDARTSGCAHFTITNGEVHLL